MPRPRKQGTDAGGGGSPRALTEVHLSSPSPVPGESTPHDFLSDVKEAATAETGWGVAFLARNPPWTPWRHRQVKPDLFYHFQEARRLAQAGQLEESLSHFDRATDLDPLNPYIRIERATVLDELGLYVDALAAYVDVVTAESWYDHKLWARYRAFFGDEQGWDTAPRRPRRSPNGHAALQLARYRVVCSLAASERLAEQWHRHYISRTQLEPPCLDEMLAQAARTAQLNGLAPRPGSAPLLADACEPWRWIPRCRAPEPGSPSTRIA